jgi:hypothetical protein
MAEASNNTTTTRFLTLPQATERIGCEELRFILEEARLLAWDRENRIECEELARSPYRERYIQAGASEADVRAVDAIAHGAPIPPESWRRWFWDGVVDLETGKIVRVYVDRLMVFRPVLRNEDVPVPADLSAPPANQVATRTVKSSRKQQLILQITAEEFPDGHDQIETGEIIKRVGDKLKRQGVAIPGRDTFLRALDRRKS